MDSVYISKKTREFLWPEFSAHFKSWTSEASYWSDLCEFTEIIRKDFIRADAADVENYYRIMKEKTEKGQLQPGTPAKKFRELHSFADFLCSGRKRYGIPDTFQDYFYPYLPRLAGQEKYAKVIPIEHIDRLLTAAENDRAAYAIFVLLYRVGLSSTEICSLETDDIGVYENGPYVRPKNRARGVYIPEDAFSVLEKYMGQRRENRFLFYNRRGNPLNPMYISRLMKKYTALAGIPSYSAQMLRSGCAYNLFAYEAGTDQAAAQMGISGIHIKRYKNTAYKDDLSKAAGKLVKIHIDNPH